MANLTAPAIGAPHPTTATVSAAATSLGTVMHDTAGNAYCYVDFTGTVYSETPVEITTANTAQAIGTTGRGRFGVAVTPATSDDYGWVQVYGKCFVQLLGATAGVSPSDAANGPTTLSTTAQTKFWTPTTATSTGPEGLRLTAGSGSVASGFYIRGLTVAHDAAPAAVSATTAATSHTGERVSVFLNWPEIVHVNPGE